MRVASGLAVCAFPSSREARSSRSDNQPLLASRAGAGGIGARVVVVTGSGFTSGIKGDTGGFSSVTGFVAGGMIRPVVSGRAGFGIS